MPERLEKLRATVEELEEELQTLDSVDEETRGILNEAMAEIQEALHRNDPDHLEPESLSLRLQHAGQDFSSTHPTLGGIVSRMIDALGQWGI